MASKALLPRECLPRRSPRGGLEPITVYVRVDEEGNYHPSDEVFQFKFVVEPAADVSSLKASTSLEEKSSGSDKVPDEKPAEVSSLKDSLKATTLEDKSSSSGQQPDQDTDLAYELKDVLHATTISEGRTTCYYHLNFTVTKGAGDSNTGIENLFFAEVKCVLQGKEEEFSVTCFCPVESTDNGYCYGCTMHRDVNMKHPISADAYLAGQMEAKKGKDGC
ncbi:hypothetical protein TRIUR3_10404 [Triticum urartu]|uniref:DUF3615 domain-containing protein n=1 Tax=Triticum urartu TaxID=4572 RepID=M7ZD68_TRIUA|nr:hypothetical protein TRIUR3_10404 [Triticum urartu]